MENAFLARGHLSLPGAWPCSISCCVDVDNATSRGQDRLALAIDQGNLGVFAAGFLAVVAEQLAVTIRLFKYCALRQLRHHRQQGFQVVSSARVNSISDRLPVLGWTYPARRWGWWPLAIALSQTSLGLAVSIAWNSRSRADSPCFNGTASVKRQ